MGGVTFLACVPTVRDGIVQGYKTRGEGMPDDIGSSSADWIAGYIRRTLLPEELDRLAAMVNDRIMAEVGQYAADEELRRDLHASTRAHWRDFLAVLGRDRIDLHTPPEAYDLARTIARRGLDLAMLLTTYRVGQRAVWTYFTRTIDEQIPDAEMRAEVLIWFWDRLSRWLDATVESLVGTYTEEREQGQRGALARRAETVHAILRGDPIEVDRASEVLSLPLRCHQTAIVLWADDTLPEADVVRALEGSAAALVQGLDGQRPLTLASGARGLWCWVATPWPPDLATLDAVSALRPGVRAAAGISAPGLPGFRRSHREALAAQSVAITTRNGQPITCYADVELACLAAGTGGKAAMRALVERELGPLAAADEATTRLRDTLREYLAHAADTRLAGTLLHVHRNTVRYRVQQAEQLLGHPVDHRRAHLELALHCHHVYGTDALPESD